MALQWIARNSGHLIHRLNRLRRSVTLGVRTLVLREAGEVLLVRHTYINGWYLPGGAVDPGEAAEVAAAREVMEECGVDVIGRPRLISIHVNRQLKGRDHVAFYCAENWRRGAGFLHPSHEIAEARFFSYDALPTDLSLGSRRRLDEWFAGAEVNPDW